MMEKELQMVFDYLDKIATKLNITVDQVWPWFIRQQYVDAVISCITIVIASCLFAGCMYVTVKYWRKERKYDTNGKEIKRYSIYHSDHEPIWVILDFVFGCIAIITSVMFVIQFFDIFNAEYWALKDIINTVKH